MDRECCCGHPWREHFQKYDGSHGCFHEPDYDWYSGYASPCDCSGFKEWVPLPYVKPFGAKVTHVSKGRGSLCGAYGDYFDPAHRYLRIPEGNVCVSCKKIRTA